MLDLNDVYYYAKVVEHQGRTAAARALDVPKSSISRRILALVVNDNACLLAKRGALKSIVGTPPGASSLLQQHNPHDRSFLVLVDECNPVVPASQPISPTLLFQPSGAINAVMSIQASFVAGELENNHVKQQKAHRRRRRNRSSGRRRCARAAGERSIQGACVDAQSSQASAVG
jgi:hypothetical protein